jgi:hypothetical protein
MAACLCCQFGWAGRAEEGAVEVEIQGPVEKQVAENQPLPARSPRPRPVFHAQAGDRLSARWKFSGGHDPAFEDVLLHFYVVKLNRLGQVEPRDLKPEDVVIETGLTMDFKGKDTAAGRFVFRVRDPGVYLARVEALNWPAATLEIPFAAMDLEIK